MMMKPMRRRFMAGVIVALLCAVTLPAQTATLADAQEWVRFALGLRSDHRATHGTWRHYNQLALQKLNEGAAVREVMVAVLGDSYNRKKISHQQYQRLANMVGRIEQTYEREAAIRRHVNGRQASRSRKSINRKAAARVFGLGFLVRKRIYTLERGQRALEDNAEYKDTLARRNELDSVMQKVVEHGAGVAPCEEAEKEMLRKQVDALNKKWADHWCTPVHWSGCGAPALDEANGLRAAIGAASTIEQCAWVQEMGSCKDGCMMSHVGDGGAKQRAECLKNCVERLPWPK